MASGDAVQQIKDRLNILDIVGQYVELHRAGKHFKGRCPFHNEKSPSFHVSPDRGTYHCFGCGVGGDIFSFVQAIDGVEFKEALKTLAQKANVELVPEQPERRTERERLYAVLDTATSYYEAELQKNSEALAYLNKRGVSKETIAKWRIGYAPGPPAGGWREVKTHLNHVGYQDGELLKAGLIKNADQGKEPFDVFRDRIMFPLRDASGKVVAFSGRILHPDEKSPKYVNSPETELFHKSDVLYGYDFAKHHIRQLPFWLLVEGQFDVVMSHQCGYATAVAVSGTALTPHHVGLLERLSKNVVLGLDTDKAGINAMKKSADLMLRRGMDVKVARFKDGADPADMIQSDVSGFKHAVGQSVHIIEFLLAHLRQEITDDRAYKLRVREEVIPFVTLIPNRIDQEHFEGIIAEALGTTKDAIHFEVIRLLETKITEPQSSTQPETPRVHTPETAEMRVKTLAYLLAARSVVTPSESAVLTDCLVQIHGDEHDDIVGKIDESLVNRLTFAVESEFETISMKVRHSELVHKLNRYRDMLQKEGIQNLRAALAVASPAESDRLLGEIAKRTVLLRRPPYTEAIFA
ncbi:MAG: DNA primase [Candidatus Pacebacteria bacterium]|jgi:DNA primase|nr:DNA primase [Candidatus Paceibacterota bacterium]